MNEIEPRSAPGQLANVAELATQARSASTIRNYRTSASLFAAWARAAGLEPLPADPQTVASYLAAEHAAGRKVSTIRLRAAAIAEAHRLAGLPNPCSAKIVADTLRGIARVHRDSGRRQKQAQALTQEHENIIRHALAKSERPKDARDLALLLVGRDLLARASELVSLTAESVRFEPDGTARVDLLRAKTDAEPRSCMLSGLAVEALRRWLEVSGIASGPVFQGLTKGGKLTGKPLSRRDVGRVLESLAERAGLEPRFSAHSLRVGMAQDLTAANIDSASIMQAAGWRTSRMLARYTQDLEAGRGAIARYRGGAKRR